MAKIVSQIYPEFGKSRHTVLSPEQFDEAEASGALIDQAIISSAEKLVSKVCTQIDLFRTNFTTISHVRNESVTLVARLIEWPLIQELKRGMPKIASRSFGFLVFKLLTLSLGPRI